MECDYSTMDLVVGALGSKDDTVQVWDARCDGGDCVAVVQPSGTESALLCGIQPVQWQVGGSWMREYEAYGDDQYKMGEAIVVSEGHAKTVMYVKFMDRRTMVSTSTKGGTIVSTRRKRKMVEKHC